MKLLTTYRALLWVLLATLLCTIFAFKQLERRTKLQTTALQAENAQLRHDNAVMMHLLMQNNLNAPEAQEVVIRNADGTRTVGRAIPR